MFESINIVSSIAVYNQIENLVQFHIAAGRLKHGDRLPTMSQLADGLDVNMNTVGKAYRDLEVMGIVRTRRGMGVFIEDGAESKCRKLVKDHIKRKLQETVGEAKISGMLLKDLQESVKSAYASDAGPYPKAK